MNKEAFKELLQRQKEGRTSDKEDKLIEEVWNLLGERQPGFRWDEGMEERVKRSIHRKITASIQVPARQKAVLVRQWLKIAAVFVVLVTAGWGFWTLSGDATPQQALIVKSTDANQRARITLPDGSVVQLNVNTTLIYPENFDDGQRLVKLDGEAFFEVTRDSLRPFLVRSGGLQTKVLGTSFNVNAYRGEREMVTVKSGKVQVAVKGSPGQAVHLVPDEAAFYQETTASLKKGPFDADQVIGWKSGRLDFDMVPFEEVVQTLERYYHTEVTLKNYQKGSCMIKASYENNGLNFILSGLQLLVDFEYQRNEDNSITIEYQSCRNS
ncbi:DUF4974 domain-containing protein [Echinicola soli]|uniref:DUF4974 domain-containing protein n=1 Tax=Echinicola soli TaxID=2591634 RepID=A0A514CNP5_9BACT|nr:FecR family protein [Echinicola soli]QDH81344.1 DUF4974 domain-containing protein [Echinicola soli]